MKRDRLRIRTTEIDEVVATIEASRKSVQRNSILAVVIGVFVLLLCLAFIVLTNMWFLVWILLFIIIIGISTKGRNEESLQNHDLFVALLNKLRSEAHPRGKLSISYALDRADNHLQRTARSPNGNEKRYLSQQIFSVRLLLPNGLKAAVSLTRKVKTKKGARLRNHRLLRVRVDTSQAESTRALDINRLEKSMKRMINVQFGNPPERIHVSHKSPHLYVIDIAQHDADYLPQEIIEVLKHFVEQTL